MKILVLLMFLASLGFSMGLANDELNEQIEQERAHWAEFAESASPACKELAVKVQECNGHKRYCAVWSDDDDERPFQIKILPLPFPPYCVLSLSACQFPGVSVERYLLCERKEMQRQLLEVQEQLDEMQEKLTSGSIVH